MLKSFIRKVATLLKIPATAYALWQLSDGKYQTWHVPYWSQFATPSLAKDILEKRLNPKDDPNWAVFGYETSAEAGYWATRQCGIVCVKMIIASQSDHSTVAELTDECVHMGGYDRTTDTGWYYKPLAQLLTRHGVRAKTVSYLPVTMLAQVVANGSLVIASVNPQIIRGDNPITNYTKSGHLVVVNGVEIKQHRVKGFVIQNPSGKSASMRENAYITTEQFRKAYGERGIVVSQQSVDG